MNIHPVFPVRNGFEVNVTKYLERVYLKCDNIIDLKISCGSSSGY